MKKLITRWILRLRLRLIEKIAGDMVVLINTTIYVSGKLEFGGEKVHFLGSCHVIGTGREG